MSDKTIDEVIAANSFHKPTNCETCNSDNIEYLGLGQYRCRDCLSVMYDDYGKVRKYVEEHPGCTEVDVHMDTGVSREMIGQFVKQQRFEVVNGRRIDNE